MKDNSSGDRKKYLGVAGAWALSFGCSVGWGSFVMPGTTFLPIAGPIGTAIGLGLGGIVMLILAVNFNYLMNLFPDSGGIYTYTKKAFGYDHGFLSAWFLILTYIAIIWANATALPLIARTVLGDVFRFGYLYEIAGYEIYLGEIILAVTALLLATIVCLFRKGAIFIQVLMALLLFVGVVICFVVASGKARSGSFTPAFSQEHSEVGGVFTIFALAPWAFVGFESITHSAAETKYNLKHSLRVMIVAVVTASIAYILLSLLAVTALPEGCESWVDYIENLGEYSGSASQPTFNAAHEHLGSMGSNILGIAALGAIFTGLIGNYIALSRLLTSLSEDGFFPKWIGRKTEGYVPKNAILSIFAISIILPFFGRTAISWIVDVTTVGATIAYALASASAWRIARQNDDSKYKVVGLIGMIISVLFALEFLIPNIISISTLSTESYLILTLWSIGGFFYFWMLIRSEKEKRMGRSIVAWIVLLGLIIFTSTVWMRQTTDNALDRSADTVQSRIAVAHINDPELNEDLTFIQEEMDNAEMSVTVASMIQIGLVVISILILLQIYSIMQRREKQTEVEKAIAEESSRAKSSFLSNMSHEIRTPMNAIIGLDRMALRDPELTPKTRDQLEKIGSSANHLLGLINDILDMSRIESGRMVMKDEEFYFKEVINQINIIINGQCQDKGLQYECIVEDNLHDYYYGDDMKLKQVMINILGNSVKFTNTPGKVTFKAEQIEEAEGKCTLRFTMKDTGIGMDKEFIPKLFETFSQEDATTTNKYGGSGLGMAITKNFVEMMGGEIIVESEKGVGSTFTVTVVLKASDKKAEETYSSVSNGSFDAEAAGVTLAGRRVLMAEDVEQNAEILSDLLELEDIESEWAVDGEKALKMFSESETGYYDVILMDVRMPVMDGLTAASEIRALDRPDAKKIPIIAMTANVFDEDVQRSLNAGMNAHLFKPVEPDKLYETMARLIAEVSEEG